MNLFIGSGRLVNNAKVNGNETKALKFVLVAKHGYNKEEGKDRVEFIPCVLFNPTNKLEEFLTKQGKGVQVEFQGRLSNSRFEANGETEFTTEVIVNNWSFNILSNGGKENSKGKKAKTKRS